MKVSDNTKVCARAEDLVTYIYGEASQDEARAFEHHLQLCASCNTELASFGDVRQVMGEWRQQALGTLAAPAVEVNEAKGFVPLIVPAPKRSALAAFRQFFTLSPIWMRAATAVVAIMFCALAAFTVAYFIRTPQAIIVERQDMRGYTEQEVEAKIAAAIKKHDEMQLKEEVDSAPTGVTVASIDQRQTQPSIERNTAANIRMVNKVRQPVAQSRRVRPSVIPASADYLPFTASNTDEQLPALTDLVDDLN